jgi:hypothetical protein
MNGLCVICGSGFSRELLIFIGSWKSSRLKPLPQKPLPLKLLPRGNQAS